MIFLLSANGRMARGKPTSSTSATNRREWPIEVESGRVTTHSAVNWEHRIDVTEGTSHDLTPCGHFGLSIKAGLTQLIVGK